MMRPQASTGMRLRVASMTVAAAVAVTAAVVIACSVGAYFYSAHHFDTLLATARSSALADGELIRAALEHQMIENDRTLIARMVESFGREARVQSLVILDRYGVKRYATGKPHRPEDLRLDSPTCQACHRYPPDQRGTSRVIDTRDGTVLRTVVPLRNRAECHRCHDPAHKINGILILDYNAGEVRAAMTRDLWWMVAGTGALTLVIVISIAVVLRVFVVRRLQRFETTARLIAAGDLNRRIPAQGADTLSWLAREFNAMADSVTGLLQEVRSQRERLETIINSIDDGIVVLDEKRTVIAANEAFLRRTGHSPNDVLGCCCSHLAPGTCTVEDCPTVACLRSGARQVRISERLKTDGMPACEEIHASPVLDESGKLIHVVEVWRDISDRRAAEAQLAESHRLASLGLLASGFSHELNTPLATVLTCVEGILREAAARQNGGVDWTRIDENAAIAREQVLRCRGVTQHFLRMSRGETAPAGIVRVETTIAAVQHLIEPTARAQRVTIRVDPVLPGVSVRADEADVQNVLVNIILNAVQACRPGGNVKVSVTDGEIVHIRVSDDGCGIAPENVKRIFEPFFSMRKAGTGLGLFLSLNFVRRWGGDIYVESEPDTGSTFDIALPAFAAADRATA